MPWLTTYRSIAHAIGFVAAAAVITASYSVFFERIFFMFLLVAVMASTMTGGRWMGVFSTGVAVLVYAAVAIGRGKGDFRSITEGAIAFVLTALVVTWLASTRREVTRRLQGALRDIHAAAAEVRTLRGMVPICAGCKKIRDDHGFWIQVERYVEEHTHAQFTHGICQECVRRFYGSELDEAVLMSINAAQSPHAVATEKAQGGLP